MIRSVISASAALLFLMLTLCVAEAAPQISRSEFASFIDGFFAGIRRESKVPGLVFVAVHDGEVLYKKGYGFTDLEGTAEVSPDATLFRIGEISSVFTAAAVLQLAERGRISLDDDVNTYLLRNKLQYRFPEPVTIRHLLTHTAGFDGKKFETQAPSASAERGFANRLLKIVPARSVPPGLYFGRASMGYALLGSIVERYSRQGFTSAVTRHIFTPLDMDASTFSPQEDDFANMAAGYSSDGKRVPYTYHYDFSALSMSTTAGNMGHFIRAALSGGAIGRRRILSEAYASDMFKTQFTPDPHIDGSCIGYMEHRVMGFRTLRAVGRMPGYSSFLILMPEKKFGMFCAANISGLKMDDELTAAVITRFFGTSERPDTDVKTGGRIPNDIVGSYRTNRISHHTAERSASFLADQIKVSIAKDSIITEHTASDAEPTRSWRPVSSDGKASDLFMMEDEFGRPTDRFLFFQRDGQGAVKTLVIESVENTYDRLAPVEELSAQTALIALFVSIALSSAIGWAISLSINKGKLPWEWEKGMRASTELWTISTIFWAIQGSFIGGLIFSYAAIGDEFTVFVPYSVKALFVLPLAGGLLLAWFCFRILTDLFLPECHWLEKLILLAVAGIEILYMLFLHSWKLLGFMF